MATSEYHTMPRERMMAHLNHVLHEKKPDSIAGKRILAALKKATTTTEIKSGPCSGEGAYNVIETVKVCLHSSPASAAALAMALKPRFGDFATTDLVGLVGAPGANPGGQPFGLYTMLE
jgi:hypothetical protein